MHVVQCFRYCTNLTKAQNHSRASKCTE